MAQKFVAIPPDLDSPLQEDLVAKTARSRLSAAGGVAKQPDPVCTFVLCNEHICPLSLLLCTGSASLFYFVVLYCNVEAHPPFVDSISLQALLNSFFAIRYQTHQVTYAVSNSKNLK